MRNILDFLLWSIIAASFSYALYRGMMIPEEGVSKTISMIVAVFVFSLIEIMMLCIHVSERHDPN